jgi:hypothetical protein
MKAARFSPEPFASEFFEAKVEVIGWIALLILC